MSKYNSSLGMKKIAELLAKEKAKIHFSGVGGVGMFSLFKMCEALGFSVSGTDRALGEYTSLLINEGACVNVGSNPEKAREAELLVYSLALSDDDPDISAAVRSGVPTVSRAELLAYLLEAYKTKISVSGSHGKSTSTAMLTSVLSCAGFSPTSVSGSRLENSSLPYLIGERDYAVFEACEYKDSFLAFSPTISIFTNLELDHTDYFENLDSIKRSFAIAARRAGTAVINADDENLRSLIFDPDIKAVSCGMSENADFRAVNIVGKNGKYSFEILKKGNPVSKISLSIPGKFSIYNALGVFCAASLAGVPYEVSAKSISAFSGIERRFQHIADNKGAPVLYDYAHHPTEIKSVINALSELWHGEINVIFKAHTYTRTKDLWDGFAEVLALADRVYLLEIDGIRENKIEGVSAQALAFAIGDRACAINVPELLEMLPLIKGAVLLLGAADVSEIRDYFLKIQS